MGYYLSKTISSLADDTGTAAALRLRRLGAKTPIGSPFSHTILSAKYWDGDTKLAYYGYRYYSPGMGRWASRDPITEIGSPAWRTEKTKRFQERDEQIERFLKMLGAGIVPVAISEHNFERELGINQSLFCRNDPLNCFDPTGLSSASDLAVRAAVMRFLAGLTLRLVVEENAVLFATCAALKIGESTSVSTLGTMAASLILTGMMAPDTVLVRWTVSKWTCGPWDCKYKLEGIVIKDPIGGA